MKPRSFALHGLAVAGLALVGSSLAACWVEPERPYVEPAPTVVVQQPPPADPVPEKVDIQTGETMQAEPGQGAGVFVEYQGGGEWRLWTVCDTAVTGASCTYALTLTPEVGATLSEPRLEEGTDSNDLVTPLSGGQLSVRFSTRLERDGVVVHMEPPGAALQVRATLDGDADPRIFYWIGPTVLNNGAPTDPLIFVPTSP